ncbi:MAG TPA: RodZ domain-containing protein [Chitinivibrionales bacterium]|nr:RodZ domain-containing protein [Chitinivibrionales bacterium]
MPDEPGAAEQQKPEPQQPELVGDLLRKERIARRVALETIAKDLKLDVKYVRALESNDYNNLPSAPYIRVYLRSVAKYLQLDPEAILKKFYEERGIHDEKFRKGSDTQIVITMVDKGNKREVKPWMVILAVIVALAIIVVLAKKMGTVTPETPAPKPAAAKPDTQHVAHAKPPAPDSSLDSLIGRLIPHDTAAAKAAAAADTQNKPLAVAKDTLAQTKRTLSFELKATKDSVWVQVFSDGVSWKNWLKPGQTKRCFARDSFNVHVGNNSCIEYTFNGKKFGIEAKDVAIFKLGRGMLLPEIWTLARWNTVFKNRT